MKTYRLEILLFLFVWLVYGLTINSRNLEAFGLQQMGVEAIVERGHFYLEGSRAPQLQPLGDVFVYKGHKYAAKQPGQFMTGALVYYFLHAFGLTYVKHYLITSALVTFLTAALLTALSVVALFRLAREMAGANSTALFWPLVTALIYGLATTVYSYSGIAHHDAIATAFVVMAFYAAFRIKRNVSKGRETVLLAAATGLFLGLTVTTSMLVFWPAIVVFVYFLSLARWSLVPYFLLGGVVGLAPLFFYDAVNFGNPFLLPNVAGNYRDTFFHLSWENFTRKVLFYSRMTTQYAPVLWLGLVGLMLLPRAFRREQLAAMAAIVVLCAYIFNIDTEGTCQYGPRYLLPVMAFGCLGLVGFSHLQSATARALASVLILLMGLLSFIINLIGAMHGTMYCDLARHAFWPHWQAIRRGETASFPLFSWLFIPMLICLWALSELIRTTFQREPQSKVSRKS